MVKQCTMHYILIEGIFHPKWSITLLSLQKHLLFIHLKAKIVLIMQCIKRRVSKYHGIMYVFPKYCHQLSI